MVLFDIWNNALWIVLVLSVLVVSFLAWIKFISNPKIAGKIARNKIKKNFGFLLDHGFEIDPRPFVWGPNGAWAIGLQSNTCKIEITQDRGYIYCDIAPIWEVREKYQDISKAILSEANKKDLYPPDYLRDSDQRLEFYGMLVEKHLDEISKYIENQPKPK